MEDYRMVDYKNDHFEIHDQDDQDTAWDARQNFPEPNDLFAIQISCDMRPAPCTGKEFVKNSTCLRHIEQSIRNSKAFKKGNRNGKRRKMSSNGLRMNTGRQDTLSIIENDAMDKTKCQQDQITDMDYYEAIRTDNAFWVDSILENAPAEARDVLLNGLFSYSNLEAAITLNKGFPFQRESYVLVLARPFCVAAVHGSKNAMVMMLDYEVDVYQMDTHGFNVVHCLIAAAFCDRKREVEMTEMFVALRNMLPQEKIVCLLKAENSDGIRPLEFAAQHASFLIMNEIFETNQIYLVKTVSTGPLTVKSYDITEYEYGGNRSHKSPILFLAHVEEGMIPLESVVETITSPDSLFKVWMERKMRYNMPLVILWFSLRLLFTAILFINHNHDWKNFTFSLNLLPENSTDYPLCQAYMFIPISFETKVVFNIYLVLHAFAIIILDVFEYLYHRKKYRHLSSSKLYKNKVTEARFKFYRACQVVLATCTIFSLYWSQSTFVFNIGFILLYTVSVWSLLYFFQLIPSVGHFVIIIQHMFKDFFHFFLIFLLLFLPFPHALFRILNESSPCLDLSNMFLFYYNTMTIMLNMVDFHPLLSRVSDPIGLMVTHILFVFVVSILLINFLVALFSASVAAVTSHKKVVVPIQRLSVIIPLEKREFLKYLLFPYYNMMQKKCFNVEGGKVHLVKKTVSYDNRSHQD